MVAPYGPVLPWHDDKLARECLRLILDTAEKIAIELNIVSLRIEPRIEHPVPSMLSEFGTGACNLVPAETLLLDLTMDAPAILAQMKAKCRYNISLSNRKGVQVRELQLTKGVTLASESASEVYPSDGSAGFQPASNCSDPWSVGVPPASVDANKSSERPPLDYLHSMLEEASDRDDFYLEPRVFFETLLSELGGPVKDIYQNNDSPSSELAPSLRLYVAEHEGDLLGALLMVIEGNRATYLYGGVSNIKRNLMPGYALQWKAILDAKSAGCTTYDFYGFDQFSLPGHAYARFSRFKRGFGGRAVRFIGAQDYVFMDRLVDNVVMFFKDLPDKNANQN